MADKGLINFIKHKVLGVKPVITKTTEVRPDQRGAGAQLFSFLKNWYYEELKDARDRISKYDKFEFLDKNLAEATTGLNVYADNIVSGARGGEENYKLAIDEALPNRKEIEEKIQIMERRTKIKDQVWEIARNLTRDGDFWGEIVYFQDEDKNTGILKLKKLPIRQIYADIDEYGSFKDSDKPYVQKSEIYSQSAGIAFDDWRIIHFKIGSDIYGVDNSIFANASQRIGRQLLWTDDSMVLARLSRAWMRYAFFVDTSGVMPSEKFEYVSRWKNQMKQAEVINRTTGRIDYENPPPMPDEDIFIPVEKDSRQDVKQLVGDMNIGNITDVEYFQAKFFMAINLPKVYGGVEEGVRAKATIGQIDVQFARQVRRRQNAIKPGLREFYEKFFILNGIDPESFKWSIVFPPLATLDEMLKWQMEKIKAEIAEILVVKIGAVNIDYVLEVILEMNQEQIKRFGTITPGTKSEKDIELTPEMEIKIKKDPYLRQMLNDLRDLVSWKMSHEEDLVGKAEVGINREKNLNDLD